MHTERNKDYIISLCTLIVIGVFISKKSAGQKPVFDNESTVCYCQTSGYSISNILQTDSNYLIIQALQTPKTIDELRNSDLIFTQSQVLLLRAFKLIERIGDKYQSTVPFLDSLETLQLRADARKRAGVILPYVENDIKDLINYLNKNNYSQQAFSILFSYVFDGHIWGVLEKKQAINKMELTMENPLWSGEF